MGRFRHKNGDEYVGEFVGDKANGKGTLTKVNGEIYDGYWIEDKPQGKGI